tara:strand:- start:105 stop:698 length:594 start_codon:yes stop_codon:yes gene_type:complete
MSDSKLLAENTIRRFMKLANVESMTDNFVNEKYGMAHKKEDDEEINEEEEFDLEEQEEPEMDEEPEVGDEPGMEEELPAEDEEMEMDMGDLEGEGSEAGDADMSLSEEEAQLLISLGEKLASAMGGADAEMDAPEMDAPEMEEPEADLDDELASEDEPEEEDPAKAYMEGTTPAAQEQLIQEILKRVTKRLVAKRRK